MGSGEVDVKHYPPPLAGKPRLRLLGPLVGYQAHMDIGRIVREVEVLPDADPEPLPVAEPVVEPEREPATLPAGR